jgi:hypothetical protein
MNKEYDAIIIGAGPGECAAQAIHSALNSPGKMEKAGRIYESLWRSALPSREFLIGGFVQRLIVREFFLNRNIGRAVKKPSMVQDLASILCHQKTKMGLLF